MCLVKPVITVSNGNLTLLGNSEGLQPQDHPRLEKREPRHLYANE